MALVANLSSDVRTLLTSDVRTAVAPHVCKYRPSIPAVSQHYTPRNDATKEPKSQISSADWFSFHGLYGTGKTQLLLELCKFLDRNTIWLRLRDMNDDEALHAIILGLEKSIRDRDGTVNTLAISDLAGRTESGCCIVLDDLPRLTPETTLCEAIISLVSVCHERGIKVLTCIHHPLPSSVFVAFPSPAAIDQQVPPYDGNDALHLLFHLGAPDTPTSRAWCELATAACQGHATLLVAVFQSLRDASWNFAKIDLTKVFYQSHADRAVSEALGRLMKSVPDEVARELVYRLALVKGEIGIEELTTVARVAPPISRPIERPRN